ncbi:MAG: hypothetical protein ABMA01_15905 [Chthoniobacteraceae bacterium]
MEALILIEGNFPPAAVNRPVWQGGRQVRRARENGTIFGHHTVEFEFADGFHLLSQCCQIGGKCARTVSEQLVPEDIGWDTEPPVKPDADGWYPVAIPGTTVPV